ncbi:TPA: hypothetical protein L9W60_005188 [Klebsiella pneumoniae]|nr:hypothetical protein [Klebsiella pneumoniae]
MNITNLLEEALKIEYGNLENFLIPYNLTAEEKLKIYEFHSQAVKSNKTIKITEQKDTAYKSIKEGVEYVHLFPKNLKSLIKEYGLSTNELLVLTEIMESMLSHGNLLINFSQKRLVELTGINKSTMSKVFKSLKDKNCLIEKDDNTYLNSVIFMKGLPHKLFLQYRDHFLNSIEYRLNSNDNFEEVFDDKFISMYEDNLDKIKKKRKELSELKKGKSEKKFEKSLSQQLREVDFEFEFGESEEFSEDVEKTS